MVGRRKHKGYGHVGKFNLFGMTVTQEPWKWTALLGNEMLRLESRSIGNKKGVSIWKVRALFYYFAQSLFRTNAEGWPQQQPKHLQLGLWEQML